MLIINWRRWDLASTRRAISTADALNAEDLGKKVLGVVRLAEILIHSLIPEIPINPYSYTDICYPYLEGGMAKCMSGHC